MSVWRPKKSTAFADSASFKRARQTIFVCLVAVIGQLGAQAAPPPQVANRAAAGTCDKADTRTGCAAYPSTAVSYRDPQKPGVTVSRTPLASLVDEAQKNNPLVLAALEAWQAAEQVPSQVSTLPDPEVMVQHVSAGTPIPFWDFQSVPMTFIGIGISQDFPYPGKLRLRGEIASRQAGVLRDRVESVRRAIAAQVEIAYFRLSYVQEALQILARDQTLIGQVESIAEARYRVGQGNQQDVLKAQLEQTQLLRDLTQYQQQRASLEAQIKQLLNRPPNSPNITAVPLVETPVTFSAETLLSLVRTGNPGVSARQETVTSRGLGVELARKDYYPDFHFQYMYQKTGSEAPDRYSLTFGVKIPIYHGRRQDPALAQATAQLDQSRREYEADVQRNYFDVQDEFLAADADSKVLKIYREGLIPQATATFQTGLAAYQVGREDFQSLLDSFLDVLNLDTEYWRTLADHERAIARLEQLTGASLP
jgi:outer membrane protein, heavy metal efflux system